MTPEIEKKWLDALELADELQDLNLLLNYDLPPISTLMFKLSEGTDLASIQSDLLDLTRKIDTGSILEKIKYSITDYQTRMMIKECFLKCKDVLKRVEFILNKEGISIQNIHSDSENVSAQSPMQYQIKSDIKYYLGEQLLELCRNSFYFAESGSSIYQMASEKLGIINPKTELDNESSEIDDSEIYTQEKEFINEVPVSNQSEIEVPKQEIVNKATQNVNDKPPLKKGMTVNKANEKAKELLKEYPEKFKLMSTKNMATFVGCSAGTLHKTTIWKGVIKNRDGARDKGGEPKAISYSPEMDQRIVDPDDLDTYKKYEFEGSKGTIIKKRP